MIYRMAAIAVTLTACSANSAPQQPPPKPGIEHQILSERERADLECARKLQVALAEHDPALGAEYQEALTDRIIAHAGKPGPVDYGPVCARVREMGR